MSEKKSMLCPSCRRLISSDEPSCPYCGLRRPGSAWKQAAALSWAGLRQDPVKGIVGVNIAFYVLSLLLNPAALGFSANPLNFLSPSEGSLFLLGATGTIPISFYGRWWTLLTASFLHGGILHIFFNMMALRQLAPFVLAEYGFHRFAVIYVWTGAGGFLLSFWAGIPFTIGASASLCGLIGAILYYGKSRGGFYGAMIYRQALGWVVGLVLFGLFFPGINNWAHAGGLLCGVAISFLTKYDDKCPEGFGHRLLGAATTLLTAAALLWTIGQAAYRLLF